MSEKTPYYITTAISYPNGKPHIGHAYEAIATDTIARFKRLDGHPVYFLTGTDEHGQKMQQTAEKNGVSPREYADSMAPAFQEMVTALGCSNDDFIRTSEARHYKASQAIWDKMVAKGDIYLDKYAGWYSVRDEAYYVESELTKDENGDWKAPTGTPVEWVEEESYFFKLSAYGDKLLALYEAQEDFIGPSSRRNEVKSFVKSGLKDLSVSRTTFDWGIPVPNNDKHIMYVWVDALTNYITALGYPDEDNPLYQKFWPASAHIIGKDIIRFHAIYWPAFLMSAELPLPKHVFAHGFLFNKGEKMSKSVGNVIDPMGMIEEYGLDSVRYYFLREVPFGQDGNYSHEAIVNRVNADLANDLGNLGQRSLSMIAKNCDGKIPVFGDFTEEDQVLLNAAYGLVEKSRAEIDKFLIHNALAVIWDVIGEANRYITVQEPWSLKKTDPERMATVLYVVAEILRCAGIMAQCVMPTSAEKLLDLLHIPNDARSFAHIHADHALKSGVELPKPSPVFPRYVEKEDE